MSERLLPYISVFAEGNAGVFLPTAEGTRQLLPPAPGACVVIHEGEWSDSIGSILNASMSHRVLWSVAAQAAQHVGLFRLPEVVLPAGSSISYAIVHVRGWERVEMEGGPSVLNLLVEGHGSYHDQFTGETVPVGKTLQLLIAPSAPLKRINRDELLEHAAQLEQAFDGFDG